MPVGGAGLIAGVAVAAKNMNPDVKIIVSVAAKNMNPDVKIIVIVVLSKNNRNS